MYKPVILSKPVVESHLHAPKSRSARAPGSLQVERPETSDRRAQSSDGQQGQEVLAPVVAPAVALPVRPFPFQDPVSWLLSFPDIPHQPTHCYLFFP